MPGSWFSARRGDSQWRGDSEQSCVGMNSQYCEMVIPPIHWHRCAMILAEKRFFVVIYDWRSLKPFWPAQIKVKQHFSACKTVRKVAILHHHWVKVLATCESAKTPARGCGFRRGLQNLDSMNRPNAIANPNQMILTCVYQLEPHKAVVEVSKTGHL